MNDLLIDTEHINDLKKTLESSNSLKYINEIFNSTSKYYNELVLDEDSWFDPFKKDFFCQKIHKLRNRFRNLGFIKASNALKDLEDSIRRGEKDINKQNQLIASLKRITFESFNLFFEQYLP